MKEFENILIFGLGLIGGSIAKKLKDSSYSGQVYGFDKDPEIVAVAVAPDPERTDPLNLGNDE